MNKAANEYAVVERNTDSAQEGKKSGAGREERANELSRSNIDIDINLISAMKTNIGICLEFLILTHTNS